MSRVITAVAAMDVKGALGKQGRIPWHIPSEFRHFKEYTMGKTLIMGRSTFESIGKPLPGRHTIILSGSLKPGERPDGTLVLPGLESALEAALGDEVIIAGGAQVYAQALPLLGRMVLSTIPMEVQEADAFYPQWDESAWDLISQDDRGEFTVNTYERKKTVS